MARIELRYCTITLKDGLGLPGADRVTMPTARVATSAVTPGATSMALSSVNIPRARNTAKVPIGARFTLASEAGTPVHVVLGRTQTGAGAVNAKQSVSLDNTVLGAPTGGTFTLQTANGTTAAIAFDASTVDLKAALVAIDDSLTASDWAVTGSPGAWVVEFKATQGALPQPLLVGDGANLTGGGGVVKTVTVLTTVVGAPASSDTTTAITFSPPIGTATATFSVGDLLSILSQKLVIKIGEGNCTYTEKLEYKYDLERGNLDAVRQGNEVPVDMKFECVYEHITTGTGEPVCPMDALKGIGGASEWVTSGPDPCEPHAIEVTIMYVPPCSGQDIEYTVFPDFRVESREIDYSKAMINCNGKCNTTQAVVSRVPQGAVQPY